MAQNQPTHRAASGPVRLTLQFESDAEFRSEFARSIAVGAAFVPTEDSLQRNQRVRLAIDLAFCDRVVEFPAEVVAVVDAKLAEIGEEAATGVSLRFLEASDVIQQRFEAALDEALARDPGSRFDAERRGRIRQASDADVVLHAEGRGHSGVTANLSYTGVLAMLSTATLPVGSQVRVELSSPAVELGLSVDGRVVHTRRCDGGQVAHGVQLQYPADRIDEVMAFIEFLQSFDRARRLAIVSGEIGADGLTPIVDLFVDTAPGGTLMVTRGEEQGRIVFSENYLLRCTAGMATGVKAMTRLFLWTEGRFEFHHELQLSEPHDEPVPIDAAMMMASVQLDELRRIGVDTFAASDTFESATPPVAIERESLTVLERRVCEHVCQGFSIEVICDMVPDADAEIYKALVVLGDLGLIRRSDPRPER